MCTRRVRGRLLLLLPPPLLSTADVVFFSSALSAGDAGATAANQDAGAPAALPTDAAATTLLPVAVGATGAAAKPIPAHDAEDERCCSVCDGRYTSRSADDVTTTASYAASLPVAIHATTGFYPASVKSNRSAQFSNDETSELHN